MIKELRKTRRAFRRKIKAGSGNGQIGGGRKTATDVEVWQRRVLEWQMAGRCLTQVEIAKKFGISVDQVQVDLKEMTKLLSVFPIQDKIKAIYELVIGEALKDKKKLTEDGATVGMLRVITEAGAKLAALYGLGSGEAVINNSLNLNAAGGVVDYGRFSNDELRGELDRRRSSTQNRDNKTGKK